MTEIFEGKTLSDVFKDIYTNTEYTRGNIDKFIIKLASLIKTPEEATLLGPVIKDFMDVSVKNNEHIVRVAQIAQRIVAVSAKAQSSTGMLSEEEKLKLLKDVNLELGEIRKEAEQIEDELDRLGAKGVSL